MSKDYGRKISISPDKLEVVMTQMDQACSVLGSRSSNKPITPINPPEMNIYEVGFRIVWSETRNKLCTGIRKYKLVANTIKIPTIR
jgi:hypothetical protein